MGIDAAVIAPMRADPISPTTTSRGLAAVMHTKDHLREHLPHVDLHELARCPISAAPLGGLGGLPGRARGAGRDARPPRRRRLRAAQGRCARRRRRSPKQGDRPRRRARGAAPSTRRRSARRSPRSFSGPRSSMERPRSARLTSRAAELAGGAEGAPVAEAGGTRAEPHRGARSPSATLLLLRRRAPRRSAPTSSASRWTPTCRRCSRRRKGRRRSALAEDCAGSALPCGRWRLTRPRVGLVARVQRHVAALDASVASARSAARLVARPAAAATIASSAARASTPSRARARAARPRCTRSAPPTVPSASGISSAPSSAALVVAGARSRAARSGRCARRTRARRPRPRASRCRWRARRRRRRS